MESTWPIALGLIGIGIVISMVLYYTKQTEQEDLRKANALDFAQAKIPNASPEHTTKLATAYLAWFETGKIASDEPTERSIEDEDLEIPYIGGRI